MFISGAKIERPFSHDISNWNAPLLQEYSNAPLLRLPDEAPRFAQLSFH